MSIWLAPEPMVQALNQRVPLASKGSAPTVNFSFNDLVDWLDFSEPSPADASLFIDKKKFELPRKFFHSELKGGNKVLSKINKAELLEKLQKDASLVVKNFDALNAKAFDLCLSIGQAFQAIPHGNLYTTPATIQTFERHSDPHDLVIVQLEGKKLWKVDRLGEFELTPGDCLYIPSGTAHEAVAKTFSMHLSIGLYPVRLCDVLCELDGSDQRLPLKQGHALDLDLATDKVQALLENFLKGSREDKQSLISKAMRRKMNEEWVTEKIVRNEKESGRWMLNDQGFISILESEGKVIVTSRTKQVLLDADSVKIMALLTRESSTEDWAHEKEIFEALKTNRILRPAP